MRFRIIGGAGVAVAVVAAGLVSAPATAVTNPVSLEPYTALHKDSLPNVLGDTQAALKREAIDQVISGAQAPIQRNGSEVARVNGRWVELKRKADKVDPLLTIPVQFGNQTLAQTGGTPGPLHNNIAAPNRATDNSTYWNSDFSSSYYDSIINGASNSMADYYYKQSGGKYTVKGAVQNWITVPYNEARYGSNTWGDVADCSDVSPGAAGGDSCGYWPLIKDTANAWYDSLIASGKTPAQITDYLKQFDVYDRYDFDGDGNFNEPDGYIDHFQAVHSGEDESAGGGVEGEDAIWAHRWYAYSTGVGISGPGAAKLGGTQIGNSGIWIGDYTVQPENGGLGVFAHEFGHDLGLPDLYDTAGGDNGTGFWTIMSAGSWLSHSSTDIGTSPDNLGAWEKLQLGWLDYTTVASGKTKTVALGSASSASGPLPQAVVVPLPDQHITDFYNTPQGGSYEWWGGSADGLNTTLTRDINLSDATSATLSAGLWLDTEPGYDFLSVEASTDGGATWASVVDPVSGRPRAWQTVNYDLSAFVGKNIKFRFRYATDGGLHYKGPFLDNITLTTNGSAGFSDDVEAGTGAWTADGFKRTTGTETRTATHYYLAEFRTYDGYDKNLKTGPYNFGFTNTKPDWVEKFPYQDGLLVWYVNNAYGDNNTSLHPGYGHVLPVDARPANLKFSDGARLGNRRQPFDATFGLNKTDAVTFHRLTDLTLTVPSSPGIPVFDDTNPNAYYDATNPQASVIVAGDGVKLKVLLELDSLLPIMLVQVNN